MQINLNKAIQTDPFYLKDWRTFSFSNELCPCLRNSQEE